MTIRMMTTEMTYNLHDHELAVLKQLCKALNLTEEDGYLIAGKLETYRGDLQGTEVDGILVLPDLVLLLELKSRNVARIDIWSLNDRIHLYRPGSTLPTPDPNPLRPIRPASQEIRDRLEKASKKDKRLDVKVFYAFIASVPHGTLDLRIGDLNHPWGIYNGVAACTPEHFLDLLSEIRSYLRLKSPAYPLDAVAKESLDRLYRHVRGAVRKVTKGDKRLIDTFLISDHPTRIDDHYVLYQGEQLETNEPVWIKEYHKDAFATGSEAQSQKALLFRDAQALAYLGNHPNVVGYKTYDDRAIDNLYVVLRREPGAFLRERMEASSLDLAQKLRVLADILDGLAHIHSFSEQGRTALYRDLRPESVFVTQRGPAQLFNFDCCRLHVGLTIYDKVKQHAQRWPQYAAKELLDNSPAEQIGPLTDVYSWAVIGYELLTNQLPYATAERVVYGDFVPLATFHLGVPNKLQDLIERALCPVAEERPTLHELRLAVREAPHAVE